MRSAAWWCRLAAVALVLGASAARAKVVESKFELSSLVSEVNIAKFSFSAGEKGVVRGEWRTDLAGWRTGRHDLRVYLYNDVNWLHFQEQLAAGSLCNERTQTVTVAEKLVLQPHLTPKEKKALRKKKETGYNFSLTLPTSRERSNYWYVLVADCSLEWWDARGLPPIHYKLEFMNGDSHLPADEMGMLGLQVVVFLGLAGGAVFFGKELLGHYFKTQRVHILILLLAAAYVLQMSSLLFEIFFLIGYKGNGSGSAAADLLSRLCESVSELMMIFVLIFLACGWTTVTLGEAATKLADPAPAAGAKADGSVMSMVRQWQRELMENTALKAQLTASARAMRRPAALVTKLSFGGAFVFAVVAAHLTLTLWGRLHMETFTQFHDHEHLPGHLLMAMRVGLWVLFLGGGWATLSTLGGKDDVARFLKRLALFGSVWLLSFPGAVFVAKLLPEYQRHSFVTLLSLACQSAALMGCSALVCTDNFRSISTIAASKDVRGALDGKKAGKIAVD